MSAFFCIIFLILEKVLESRNFSHLPSNCNLSEVGTYYNEEQALHEAN